MNITYIGHSGFSVELENSILLFDYFEGVIPAFPPTKPIYVFSSHFHHDHFNMDIFKLADQYPSVTYILSDDIRKKYNRNYFLRHHVNEQTYDSIYFLPEHTDRTIGALKITTLLSTDEGVAFLVESEGLTIYHAGDLHWWTWGGETEEEYQERTLGYQTEIARLSDIPIDVAFLVLDPRQEEDRFFKGLDYFMRNTDTRLVYPMHFWKDPSVIDKFLNLEITAPYRERIMTGSFYQ
ncbi:MBL fold metallo-hydrolase [Hespellia stercorisuis]|uniref:L-ascorbate metabolism protein UlaG, beta-lactamase superfamily n=1 Tax=Hespellia stercorisuis DSM 15480 TaxID=1121950 RepID=A0A1M6MFT1_9FIRM|nr:MBL fold metallo-hydrolase [Hespellia stercorisuis]SHJ82349.1 L-ascorbate metabolism protein UlaG, beta-lactamase superfamily [Hespellia stercorisuis DSM 15480]